MNKIERLKKYDIHPEFMCFRVDTKTGREKAIYDMSFAMNTKYAPGGTVECSIELTRPRITAFGKVHCDPSGKFDPEALVEEALNKALSDLAAECESQYAKLDELLAVLDELAPDVGNKKKGE